MLRDPQAADALVQEEIRRLAQQRFATLAEEEPFDPDVMGYLVVVEPGDAAETLSQQLGFDVLTNRYDGTRFDEPGFAPSFELLEEHRTCYEIVYVICDDGFGVVVFVPKEEGIDSNLLAMCAMHSVTFEGPSQP